MSRREIVFRIAPAAPPCFDSRVHWLEFVTSASEEKQATKRGPLDMRFTPARFNSGWDFCDGCLAKHALAMLEEGRCVPDHLQRIAQQTIFTPDPATETIKELQT